MRSKTQLFFAAIALPLVIVSALLIFLPRPSGTSFNGSRALQDVQYQVDLGPRVPGTPSHSQFISWITADLEKSGWEVSIQDATELGHPIRNIIAKRGTAGPWIILCAHYDSRQFADQDPNPDNRALPVPGANDGASGVAVLLEIARVLPKEMNLQIWLVFFDAEDQGNIPGWDWILGSTAFVKTLEGKPEAVILLDMIGDADLRILLERTSTQRLAQEVWQVAEEANYGNVFIPEPGHSILDDHTPFLNAGIPAIDIIDFDYPYYHTLQDTADKVSAKSLQAVGETIIRWLEYRSSH